jgi:hypothetical protein
MSHLILNILHTILTWSCTGDFTNCMGIFGTLTSVIWLFTSILNVNHASYEKHTSSATVLCTVLNLWSEIFPQKSNIHIVLLNYTVWNGYFLQNFGIILCRRCHKWTLIALVNTFWKRAQTIWGPQVIRDNKQVTAYSEIQISRATTCHSVSCDTYMH